MPIYQNEEHKRAMENRLGCVFCPDGIFAEMYCALSHYQCRTQPIDGVTFREYEGDPSALGALVAEVDAKWCRYFTKDARVFVAKRDGKVVAFCMINSRADCILSHDGVRVGSIGCVGTLPNERGKGIGLRLVDLATVLLKNEGCDLAYVSYTHLDFWYERLGYKTFARFSFT